MERTSPSTRSPREGTTTEEHHRSFSKSPSFLRMKNDDDFGFISPAVKNVAKDSPNGASVTLSGRRKKSTTTTVVAFGRTTPVMMRNEKGKMGVASPNVSSAPRMKTTSSPSPANKTTTTNSTATTIKRDSMEYVSPKYTNKYAREHSRVSRVITAASESTKPMASPRVKRAMEYARQRMMEMNKATTSVSCSTSERVARILAAAKAKVHCNTIDVGGVVVPPASASREEEEEEEKEEKKKPHVAEKDVVVAPPPKPKPLEMVALVENEEKRIEEVEEVEEVGVEMRAREEEQKEKDEAVVASIPAPPPPPSAVTRAVAFKSLGSKKESFKSLPNANQSAFWLKKCNVALARGDEEAACLALRTGISRKAQPTEELSEKLKELVTMKMNEAIEASEKIEEAEEVEVKTPKEEESTRETVNDAVAPRSASSSEEFEFKTIQKVDTADFAQAAIEHENKLIVSEAMAMIVRESPKSPTTEVPRRQSMDNSRSQRTLEYEGVTPPLPTTTTTPDPVATATNQTDEEFAFRVSPASQDAPEEFGDQVAPAPSSSSPPTASPLSIFAKLMGKIITDTLELTDEAAKKAAAAAQSPPQITRSTSSPEPYVSPAVMVSTHISPRSPVRRQHSLDMKKFYERGEEEVEEEVKAAGESTPQPELSPSKTPWSKLKKVKDVKSERKSTIKKKKKSSTPRRPKLDR
ncbi:unnamed protein product [Bathycoccus prasinos]